MTEICNFTDIISIEEIDEREDVFDITVEDNHNFFANGMVVHNCIGGIFSNRVLRGQAMQKSDAEIQAELRNLSDRFVDAVGLENFNLELQFNKLQAQHDVNRHLISLHKDTGIPLVATCDSHYPTPDKWKTRELYKKLAWMNAKEEPKPLPAFEELKCELYPKNATQMWEEFNRHTDDYEFYKGNEVLVRDAIERTHDIAWQQCEDVWVDSGAKLPVFDTPDRSGFQQLVDLVKERMVEMGLHEKPEYMERVKEELADIKYLGHASYFLTMNKIFHKAAERTLLGPGRGCFIAGTRVKMADGLYAEIENIKVGDAVIDAYGNTQNVINLLQYEIDEEVITLTFDDGKSITCTKDHEFLTQRGFIKACELADDDVIADV